jgi:hypothetical protein
LTEATPSGGWIAFFFLIPAAIIVAVMKNPMTVTGEFDEDAALREEAIVETLRRNPGLGTATDTESLTLLATSVDAVEKELRLLREVQDVQARRGAVEEVEGEHLPDAHG